MYSTTQNMNKANFTVLEDIFPLQNVPENNYGEMGQYNSNRIIPSYDDVVPPPPAAQFINQLEMQYPGQKEVNGIFLPRSTNFEAVSRQQIEPTIQYGQFTVPPGFAGGLPYLKNAIQNDRSVVMNPYGNIAPAVPVSPQLEKPLSTYPIYPTAPMDINTYPYLNNTNLEKFRYNNKNPVNEVKIIMNCGDIYDHLQKCEGCRKRFSCEKKTYLVIIIMLVIVFSTIIFLLQRK
jgi:hypothetical protein